MSNNANGSYQAKILLVDDTPANLQILSKILTDHGYKIRAVTDGQLAINSAQAAPPDLILLDISMPDMDGYECCTFLKSNQLTQDIPVIFISALGETEDKIKAFQVGGIDYITKPFQVEEVLARVKTHITIHQLKNQILEANKNMASNVEILRQLEAQEHEQRVFSEALRAISSSINSDLDLDVVLNNILNNISGVVSHDVVNITMIDEEGYAYIVREMGYKKYMSEENYKQLKLQVSSTLSLKKMYETKQPYLVEDVSKDPDWVYIPGANWLRSYLGAPILVRSQVVGFINLDSNVPGFYKQSQADILFDFATQAGIAIGNANLYREAQRRVKELSILNEISQSISSTTNLEDVTELIYQQINRLVEAQFFIIVTYTENSDFWQTVYIRKDGVRLENQIFNLNQGFTGYVIKNRKAIYLPNKKDIDRFVKEAKYTSVIADPLSIMIVPLIFSNKVVGAIGVQHDIKENAFSRDDYSLFNNIGSQVAVWIENARLFAEMEKLAITDTLTGVYNRRQLFILAQQELERAYRYNHNASIIMLDIDHFKKVNDNFGHPVGDEVLRKFANICVQNLRQIDLIGRYGGEEFLIIMPETEYEEAIDAAERLRQKISEMKVNAPNGSVQITVSMGVVSLNHKVESANNLTLDQLIQNADAALYRAKASGRNRVCG